MPLIQVALEILHIFVSVPSQALIFQCPMPWSFYVQ